MRDPFYLDAAAPASNQFASPEQGASYRPSVAKDREGIFLSTRARYLAVTALLWSGLIAACVTSWYGAFSLSVRFAHWMGH